MTGSYGKGGPNIRLITAYGTVRIAREGSVVPAPKGPKAPPEPAQPSSAEETEESL